VLPRKQLAVKFPHPRSHFRSTYATRDVSSLRLIATYHGPGIVVPDHFSRYPVAYRPNVCRLSPTGTRAALDGMRTPFNPG